MKTNRLVFFSTCGLKVNDYKKLSIEPDVLIYQLLKQLKVQGSSKKKKRKQENGKRMLTRHLHTLKVNKIIL